MADNKRKCVVNMNDLELLKHVKVLARVSSNIVFVAHTKWLRMKERSISAEDIAKVLRSGTMNRPPEPGNDYPNEIKCRINGRDVDNKLIGVEVAVSDDNPLLIVVTVIRYRK